MAEQHATQTEYEKLLRQTARDLPPLDRRHKQFKHAICLATAQANRKAFGAARARLEQKCEVGVIGSGGDCA
ncbi:MAG: hypothetical protein ACWA47_12930 [Brevirhabdus sp.]